MNISYKIIFNQALGIFVAVSELGKSRPKNKTRQNLLKLSLLSSSLLFSPLTFSATSIDYIAINTSGTLLPQALATDSIAVGKNSKVVATAQKSLAIGTNTVIEQESESYATASNSRKSRYTGVGSVALGDTAKVYGSHSVALGYSAIARGWGTMALGGSASSVGDGSIAFGYAAKTIDGLYYGNSNKGGAVAIGLESTTINANTVAIGNKSFASGWKAIAIGNNARTLDISHAANADSLSESQKNYITNTVTSLRQQNTPEGREMVIVEQTLANEATSSIAIGDESAAIGWGSTALGTKAYALNDRTTVLGDDSKALGYAALAVGTHTYSLGLHSNAIGSGSQSLGDRATAVGTIASATGEKSLASGYGVVASGKQAIAIGAVNTDAKGWYTTNGGRQVHEGEYEVENAAGDYSISLGSDTQAKEENSIAVGQKAVSTHTRSIALGDSSSSESAVNTNSATINDISYDGFAGTTSVGTVSVGNATTKETRQIKNVSAGEISKSSTDAINGSQLYIAVQALSTDMQQKLNDVKDSSASVSNGSSAISVKKGNTTTTGNVEITDYVVDLAQSTKDDIQKGVDAKNTIDTQGLTFNSDNGATNEQILGSTITINGDGKNISTSAKDNSLTVALNDDISLNSIKLGDVNINKNGIDAGNTKITNVAAGDISPTSNDVINGSQFYELQQSLTQNIQTVSNKGLTFTGNSGATNEQKLGSSVAINGKKNITTTATGDNLSIALNDDIHLKSVTTGNVNLSENGLNNGGKTITNVANGIEDTDAVNVAQLKDVQQKLNNVKDTTASVSAGSESLQVSRGNTVQDGNIDVVDYVVDLSQSTKRDIQKGVVASETVANKGLIFEGDTGSTDEQKLGNKVAVKGDKNITTKASGNQISVSLNENLNISSVTTGSTVINNSGVSINDVHLTQNGLNNGGNRITNIADGIDDSDAVNAKQLRHVEKTTNARINQLDRKIDHLDKNLRAGIAGATAVAFLQRPNQAGKSMISAAAGGYKGESAVALGYARNSDNNKVSIKLGVGVNSRHDVSYGGSIGYQW